MTTDVHTLYHGKPKKEVINYAKNMATLQIYAIFAQGLC